MQTRITHKFIIIIQHLIHHSSQVSGSPLPRPEQHRSKQTRTHIQTLVLKQLLGTVAAAKDKSAVYCLETPGQAQGRGGRQFGQLGLSSDTSLFLQMHL